jgi:hypothetical protein
MKFTAKFLNVGAAPAMEMPTVSDPTQTPEFKSWFKGSKAVDRIGRPQVVFHGSTHNFEKFDMSGGNPENYYGKGLYFTDSKVDVGNYGTHTGPDLTGRIERRVEQIMEEEDGDVPDYGTPEYEVERLKAEEKAKQELIGGNKGVVYLTYLRILRPVIVDASGGTEFYLNYNEETGNETGSGVKLAQACITVGRELGVDGQRVWVDAWNTGELYDDFSAYDFEKAVRQSDSLIDDLEGGSGVFIAAVYRAMGFDGIILKNADKQFNMNMSPGTTHYIVWNPRQVKSAIGNSGKFNPRSPRMTASDDTMLG